MSNSIILLKIVWILYVVVLIPTYIIIKGKHSLLKTYKTKLALSISFCITGLIGTTLNDFSFFSLVIFLGLIFSLVGDYYMIPGVTILKKFYYGIICFGITHVFYLSAIILTTGFHIIELIIALLICIALFYYIRRKQSALPKESISLYFYSPFLIFMTLKAVIMIFYSSLPILSQVLFSLGAILFFISDLLFGINRFINKKAYYDTLNIITYFTGQLMIASSLFYL